MKWTDEEIKKVNMAREISGEVLIEKEPIGGSEGIGETPGSFQRGSINVDKNTFEKVGKFPPKQIENAVFANDSQVSSEGKDFFRRVIATNSSAKAGKSFKEYLERYFDSKDFSKVTQEELGALGEIYKKMGGK